MQERLIDAVAIPGIREPVSCLSHLIGAAVFAALTTSLVERGRGCRARTFSLAAMGCSAVFLLVLSGVYHMYDVGDTRQVLRRLDVAAVFVMIAGTITPIHGILFTGLARWLPLVLVWSTAIAGISLRMAFYYDLPEVVSLVLFLVMGWAGAASALLLWRRYGFSFIRPLIAGGLAYTVGAILLELHWPSLIPGIFGPHELWHAAVLVGLSCHWRFTSQFASGTVSTRCGNAAIRAEALQKHH